MTYQEMAFESGEVRCSGWHFPGTGGAFDGGSGRPVVVMGHGFAGTKDSGLRPFAEGFQAAGLDVLAFDYRGFGTSGGAPRQTISLERQLRDYHNAVDAASGDDAFEGAVVVTAGG